MSRIEDYVENAKSEPPTGGIMEMEKNTVSKFVELPPGVGYHASGVEAGTSAVAGGSVRDKQAEKLFHDLC